MKKHILILALLISNVFFAQKFATGGRLNVVVKNDGTLWAWINNSDGYLVDDTRTNTIPPIQIGTSADWKYVFGCGYNQTMAIKNDGSLWSFDINSKTPTQIGSDLDWKFVAGNQDTSHQYAIKNNGTLWAWGENTTGQLGDGTKNFRREPTQIGTATDWKLVVAGRYYTMAIKNDGTIWSWGNNSLGQLGDGTATDRLVPTKIGTATDWKDVVVGENHTIALKNDGTLWSWGDNFSGQLGYNTVTTTRSSPTQIGTDADWKVIVVKKDHSMAIKNNGTLWAWGSNVTGQLGDGTITTRKTPTQIGTATDWKLVSAGEYHTLAIKNNGALWAWGSNVTGQLGDGTATNRLSPIQVGTSTDWKEVIVNDGYNIAIKIDNSFWSWGLNSSGQLGNSSSNKIPIQIGIASDWKLINAGLNHSAAIKNNGTLWAWGDNSNGQLGDGTKTTLISPTQIGTDIDWKLVEAGLKHTIAIKNNGTLWAWGDNSTGQLGDGTTTSKITPTQIGTATDWKLVVTGFNYTMAIKNDGTLWGWGDNSMGQLGDYTTTNRISPTKIGTAIDWKLVVAGRYHTIAIKNDGTIWGSGLNASGELGINNNSIAKTSTFSIIGTAADWESIDVGSFHTSALKNFGTLWVWGNNQIGQLGDGTEINRITPTQIGTETNWKLVGTGDSYTVAIKNDGTLWGWGRNESGQLGDGTKIIRITPTQIGTSTDWKFVDAGLKHTLAIKNDGTLWAWGDNSLSQLGKKETFVPNIIFFNVCSTPQPTGNSTQTFCSSASISNLTATGTAIQWYAAATGGTALSNTTDLVNDGVYYASQTLNSCESASRLAVTANIITTPVPTGNTPQSFCSSVSLANLVVTGTDIKWYNSATGGLPISNTMVYGPGATSQTSSSTNTLYASQTLDGCESSSRLAVTFIIENVTVPTGSSTQIKCPNSTIANLNADGGEIKWYTGLTGGTAIPKTTTLVNGTTYYATQTQTFCESSGRLAVTVNITNTAEPIGSANQTFLCSSPTVSNLAVTGTAIKWYATPTGGSALANTTTLVNGTTYYASQTLNSCESTSRLAVTVNLTNTAAPTGSSIQNLEIGSTLSNIVVSGTAIKWYNSATGGAALNSTTALVNEGVYYASQTLNSCESQSRFMVKVTLSSFLLPFNNFAIETKSETCATKNNGQIIITATQTNNYFTTINGKNYNFVNNGLTVPDLAPGVYTFCIGVTGKTFEQCYSVTIGKGAIITGKSSFSSNKAFVDISSGTGPFEIVVNGTPQFETSENNFSVDVKQGDLLEIKTSVACEGIYSTNILDGLIGVIIHPNPTAGLFEITIPTSKTEIEIELYSISSQLISKRKYPVINHRVQLSLEKEPNGIYFAKLNLDSPLSLTIIKKS